MPTPSSTPSSTPNSTIISMRASSRSRKRLSAILACSTISPTLDMFDFSMLHAQLSDTPQSSVLAHRSSDEEFTSFELIPLRKLSRGIRREPIPFFANATQPNFGTHATPPTQAVDSTPALPSWKPHRS